MTMKSIVEVARSEGRKVLDVYESRQVLQKLGVPLNRSTLASGRAEAVRAAGAIGFPVVMKIVSPEIIHKTDVGGVRVDIADGEGVGREYDAMMARISARMPDARIRGVVVEEMLKGTELIIGSSCDPQFGRMLMFGMGGVFVEVYKDVSFRLVPITEFDAFEMIEEIRGKAIFEGARGYPKVDKSLLARILVDLSAGLEKHPEIGELDINPLLATEKGPVAVDARVILSEPGKNCRT
jgi:succinyl-CoA synthetase beta subunit